MKALKEPTKEKYGMCYLPRLTDEFKKLIEDAREIIEPYCSKEVSRCTFFFKVKNEEVSSEFNCCDNEECIKESKTEIRKQYGKYTRVEECWHDNDGDHEQIETCCVCGRPLNEWLTWCNYELEYLEENKPWDLQFLKGQGFLIHCILQSMPTLDCDIGDYAKHNQGDILKKSLERREEFFQRVGELTKCITKYNQSIK